ncbi:hypothetical protein HY992_03590 [Candidatus Micrarchaeota archaeon]|nr:hypothetical protein [Candidatus Micrarchaeota archaeon]
MFEELLENIDPRTLDAANFAGVLFFPTVLVLASAFCFWLVQTIATKRVYKIVLAEAGKNKVANFLVAWASIASHELLGHFVVGVTTGSKIKEVHVGERRGHVVSGFEQSFGGFSSLLFTSLAPCFMPPIVLVALAFFLFPGVVVSDWTNGIDGVIASVVESVVGLAIASSDFFNLNSLLFVYLLVVVSLTASSSPEDVAVVIRQAVARPPAVLFLFVLLGVVVFTAEAIGANVVNPLLWVLLLSFAVVIGGLAVALAATFYLKKLREARVVGGVACMLLLVAIYVGLRMEVLKEAAFLSFAPFALVTAFATSLLIATVIAAMKKRKKIDRKKRA